MKMTLEEDDSIFRLVFDVIMKDTGLCKVEDQSSSTRWGAGQAPVFVRLCECVCARACVCAVVCVTECVGVLLCKSASLRMNTIFSLE